jgi:DNA ligase-1
LAGTHITCDARGFPSDLIFISHAHALGKAGPSKLASARSGRRQILATDQTLRLLGEPGDKLRSRALPGAFGRPFNLGGQRIEIVPSGHLPGAAGLLCETKSRRTFYLGAFSPELLVPGTDAAEVRHADAICIDSTYGHPHAVFPPRKEVLADIHSFVTATFVEQRTPVLLVAPSALLALTCALAQAKVALRAHPRLALELARLHEVCPAIPAVPRAGRKPSIEEAWIWPADAGNSTALRALPAKRLALISGSVAYPDAVARKDADCAFPLTSLPSHAEILSVIKASGAREVALFQAGSEALAADLQARGFDAYTLGPPRQMTLVA